MKDGKCLRKFEVQLSKELAAVTVIKLNPSNSKVFAAYPVDRSVKIFGLKSGSLLREIRDVHQGFIQSLNFLSIQTKKETFTTDEIFFTSSFDG